MSISLAACVFYSVALHDAGFDTDEVQQLEALEAQDDAADWSALLHLWHFREGSADELQEIRRGVAEGTEPWCTDTTTPRMRVGFFRPLGSLWIWLDHGLFGLEPPGYHLLTRLGFLALLLGTAALYGVALRREESAPGYPLLAAGALLLFAVDSTHTEPVARIATRHLLLATLFGSLGLWAWVRWREQRWRRGLPLALACFGLGVLSSETFLQFVGYLVAFEWLGRRAPVGERIRSCAAIGLASALYVLGYALAGYGASGGGYLDPIDDPAAWLRLAPLRWSDLALEEYLSVPSWRGWHASPWMLTGLPLPAGLRLLGGALTAAAVALVAWGAPRWLSPGQANGIRWLALGSLLSLVPVTLGPTGGRLLLVPSLGASAVVAAAIALAWQLLTGERRAIGLRAVGVGLLVLLAVRVVGSPLALYFQLRTYALGTRVVTEHWRPPESAAAVAHAPDAEAGPPDASDVIVLAAPSTSLPATTFPVLHRIVEGDRVFERPEEQGWIYLSDNLLEYEHWLRRIGPAEFEFLLGYPKREERFMNSLWAFCPLPTGTTTRAGPLEIKILGRTRQGGISRIRVKSDRDLDSDDLWLVSWQDGALRRIEPPPVGETLVLR